MTTRSRSAPAALEARGLQAARRFATAGRRAPWRERLALTTATANQGQRAPLRIWNAGLSQRMMAGRWPIDRKKVHALASSDFIARSEKSGL